jgi:hypothetical protein
MQNFKIKEGGKKRRKATAEVRHFILGRRKRNVMLEGSLAVA